MLNDRINRLPICRLSQIIDRAGMFTLATCPNHVPPAHCDRFYQIDSIGSQSAARSNILSETCSSCIENLSTPKGPSYIGLRTFQRTKLGFGPRPRATKSRQNRIDVSLHKTQSPRKAKRGRTPPAILLASGPRASNHPNTRLSVLTRKLAKSAKTAADKAR